MGSLRHVQMVMVVLKALPRKNVLNDVTAARFLVILIFRYEKPPGTS